MKAVFIEELKKDLLQKKESLEKRLEALDVSKKRKEPLSADWSEQAVELENHEVVDALDDMEFEELKKINIALNAIDNEGYGICNECGDQIGEARLKAIPYSQLCIDCAK